MKKYSEAAGKEMYIPAPAQLDILRQAGYAVQGEADTGTLKIIPPPGERTCVDFDRSTGEFSVLVKRSYLQAPDVFELQLKLLAAAALKGLVELADPDRPKAAASKFPKNSKQGGASIE